MVGERPGRKLVLVEPLEVLWGKSTEPIRPSAGMAWTRMQLSWHPRMNWVNTTTGHTDHCARRIPADLTRVPGTDEFTLTIVGHRYMVNQPGLGVTVQEVGRIIYADPSEETILAMAGQHDLVS